jgi:hypothetical protein
MQVGAVRLYCLLFMAFFAVGLVLVLFGHNLDAIDIWLDQRADWFDRAGTILFKAFLAITLACCVFVVGKGIFDRLPLPGRPPRYRNSRSARAGGGRRTARAGGGPRVGKVKGAPRLAESGEPLPAADGGGERMAGYRLETGSGDRPMGWGAMIAAIVIGYFAYVSLVN